MKNTLFLDRDGAVNVQIIGGYVELLERTIRRKPQYWLWSHRRWKFKF